MALWRNLYLFRFAQTFEHLYGRLQPTLNGEAHHQMVFAIEIRVRRCYNSLILFARFLLINFYRAGRGSTRKISPSHIFINGWYVHIFRCHLSMLATIEGVRRVIRH